MKNLLDENPETDIRGRLRTFYRRPLLGGASRSRVDAKWRGTGFVNCSRAAQRLTERQTLIRVSDGQGDTLLAELPPAECLNAAAMLISLLADATVG